MRTVFGALCLTFLYAVSASAQTELFPANGATEVNPDTRLRMVFSSAPPLHNAGKVRVYDAADDSLVDELDMSIPPGPRNTRTPEPYDTFKYSSVPDTVFTVNEPDTDPSHIYQKNYVGGTDEDSARHFFPILVEENTATIFLHNHKLAYGKTYYVQVDSAIFPFEGKTFTGISGKETWRFTTKQQGPAVDASLLTVSSEGLGDFSTVQGAIDSLPDANPSLKEIYVSNGTYDEIVVLRNKQNITLHGEDRAKVIVRYANNGVFNRVGRYEFTITGATSINLVNLTIQSVGKDENPAQAEALFVRGDKYQVHNVTMLGSGDALQIQTDTRLYVSRSSIRGYGDNLLSYGAAFFKRCDMISTYGPHGWPRNPQSNHGDVFVESTFALEGPGTSGDGHCTLARSPASSATNGVTFPYAEFVLINCKLQGIAPEGWGAAGPEYSNVHFWEYNSTNLTDGTPVDVSQRVAYSRQLTMANDAEIIASYSDPTYVLGGWTPELAPIVLTALPASLTLTVGESAELIADAAAAPDPMYQWHKDGQPLAGETSSVLKLQAVSAASGGEYAVSISNSVGTTMARTSVVVAGPGTGPGVMPMPMAGGISMASGSAGIGPQGQGTPTGGQPASAGTGAQPIAAGTPTSNASDSGVPTASPERSQAEPAADSGSASGNTRSGGCAVGPTEGGPGALGWLLMLAAVCWVRRTSRARRC